MLFIPNMFINLVYPPYSEKAATELNTVLDNAAVDEKVRVIVSGKNSEGSDRDITLTLTKSNENDTSEKILRDFGLVIIDDNGQLIVDDVLFGSKAQSAGVDIDLTFDLDFQYVISSIGAKQEQPSKRLVYIPALILFILVAGLQFARKPKKQVTAAA